MCEISVRLKTTDSDLAGFFSQLGLKKETVQIKSDGSMIKSHVTD